MVPYFGITEDQSDRTLLGYAWRGQPYSQRIAANKPLDVVSVCLLPRGVKRVGLALGCDPLALGRALTQLDGSQDVAGLNTCFDEMRRARPSAALASAYYEAKIIEACALLVDWSLANPSEAAHPLSTADRTALKLVRTYLADNLERTVGTDELCRVACMSASKLARIFRKAEGTTPQDYARGLRMERACTLLDASDLTIAEIASALGFARQGSFSEAFRNRFGVTPRAFRASRQARRS